jgi:phosphoribosylformimino-5-aminoimidazole carboxamide ribotide isomerase
VRIVGVIDLLGGRAVHAVAGARGAYRAVHAVAGASMAAGDSIALARHYVERLGVDAVYVADLDAIQGRPLQQALVAELCRLAVPVFVDGGVSTVDAASDLRALGAAQIVVGLETLSSFDALAAICAAVSGDHVVFSLDLRDGTPIATNAMRGDTVNTLVAGAVDAGVETVIALDLARVGTGVGLDLDLIAAVRCRVPPHATVLAGGGVRGWTDLEQLAATGCDGALVATALQQGTIGAREIERARQL